jgi:hypothetical protein
MDMNLKTLTSDSPLAPKLVIPAQAGIQLFEKPRAAGQHHGFARFAGCSYCWIPACAGMTGQMD